MAKLPEFEKWTPPWTAGAIDEAVAARLVYNLKADLEKAATKLTEVTTAKDAEIEAKQVELDSALAGKAGTDAEAQNEIKELRKQVRELTEQTSKTRPEDQKVIDRLKVAHELGLTLADSARLVGETYDEIKADGIVFAKDHGIEIDDGDGEQEPAGQPSWGVPPELRSGTEGRRRTTVVSDPAKAKASLPPL